MRKNPGAVHQFYLTKITTPSKAARHASAVVAARAARWLPSSSPPLNSPAGTAAARRASPVVADSHARALVRFSAVNPPEWMLLSR